MKKVKICLCMLSTVIMLGGCGSQIPDMTEEERAAISEYAVELLLKYDTNQSGRLVDLPLLEEETPTTPEPTQTPEPTPEPEVTPMPEDVPVAEVTPEPEDAPVPETMPAPEPTADTPGTEAGEAFEQPQYIALEDTLLLPEHVTLQYLDYQITDVYTDPQETTLTLDAAEGSSFIVVRFALLNSGSEAQNVDLLHDNIMYDIIVDGTAVDGMVTMLSNDMITYTGTLKSDESCELVLLAEAENSLLQNAESIWAKISCGELVSGIEMK